MLELSTTVIKLAIN